MARSPRAPTCPAVREREVQRVKRDHLVVALDPCASLRQAVTFYLATDERQPDKALLYPKKDRSRLMIDAAVPRWFKRCLEHAGLPGTFGLHDLRRAAGQPLYDLTGDLLLAKDLLRHESVATTQIYLTPSRTRLEEALNRLDRI